jgi:hypothetical protein
MSFRRLAILAMALLTCFPALAADWVVTRLRGNAEILVDGSWQPLRRGDVVGNEQMLRTLAGGHAELKRDNEIVTLGSNTEIRIRDEAERGYTTVLQDFGRVEVDAEARRVRHFEVRTPYLAAVVKGTHFVVTSGTEGASVAVDRGAVSVLSVASERSTTIKAGQTATVKRRSDLVVGGLGPWPAIVEPGVSRPMVAGALGGALGAVPGDNAAQPAALPAAIASTDAQPMATGPGGGVSLISASSSTGFQMGGLAASRPSTTASAEPAQPVSLGIVLLGALLGAALGGIGLLLRRGL